MSKQTTLFSTWGGHSSTTRGHGRGDNTDTCDQEQPALNLDDSFDYDQFLEDDLRLTEKDLEALCDLNDDASLSPGPQSQTNSFHVGPSHSFLNSSIIEEEIPGFDNEAGQLWIYPTNYPLRDYQFNIIHKALFTNTLVCLPTGLGKTFIAAVVMYNFYRWYPNGKIVFLAPTKPLVTQQIEACHNVMGIPQEHSAEMTGQMSPKMRTSMWQTKRVFFLTPQVMQNDLQNATCPAQDVCCVVFDEAHKALGNHAYCQVVKELFKSKVRFRVLALSATPGNDLKAVQQVVINLQVGHIELRSEDSIDIQRYSHERKVEKIVVPLDGEILGVKDSFARILSGVLNRLIRYGVLYHCTPDRLSKYQLLQAREQFRVNGASSGVMPGTVEGDFASAISLFHAYELLQLHGMKSFYQFLTTTFTAGGQQSKAKAEILRNPQFGNILKRLRESVRLSESSQLVADRPALKFPRMGGGPSKGDDVPVEEKPSFFYSHPKLRKLEDIVLGHFRHFHDEQSDGPINTRAMIFSQYRDSVQEITDMLNRHSPLVRVMSFVGHSTGKSSSKGLTQKEQTEIVRKFRDGGYNTLVATCVGEEGLDIGDVDLIVCFDAPKSPIRLVQRMGRTGRKRKGRIVMIVAEGKEDHVYNKSQSNKKSIHRAISNGCKTLTYYQQCHRMVPKHINPQVHKMRMCVSEFISSKRTKKESSSNHVKPRSNQTKIKFGNGGKKVKMGTYLNDQELTCWSEGLSLSDREFKVIEKSVERCFSQQPLLCIPSLNTNSDSVQSNTSTLGRSVCSVNTSLNSSVGRMNAAFSLGLDKWVNDQTSSIPPRIAGPSIRSEHLMSTLEFIDILRTSDGMGQSYDLEMETFLDQNDVRLSERADGLVSTGGDVREDRIKSITPPGEGSPNAKSGGLPTRIKVAKMKQFFDESSGDEDFLPSKKPSAQVKVAENLSYSTKSVRTSLSPRKHSGQMSTPPIHESHSQHVIPRAPSEDGLDWLDELEPSQMSTPHLSHTKTSTSMDLELSPVIHVPGSKDKGSTKTKYDSQSGGEFNFATPKLPLSSVHRSKLRPSKYSTPAVEHDSLRNSGAVINETPVKNDMGSIDLFEDLSAHALFDDFSTSGIEVVGVSKSSLLPSAHINLVESIADSHPSASINKLTEHSDKQTDVIVFSDSDDDFGMDVHVIKESDLDQDDNDSCIEDDGTSTVNNPLRPGGPPTCPHANEYSLTSKRSATTSNEDSFLQVHRKCRKRPRSSRNAFLQSPTSPSDSKQSSKLSPGSKENVPYKQAAKELSPNSKCLHSRKMKPKVTFEWDSSDDEFALPLSKRIAQSKSSKFHTKPPLSKRSDSSLINRTSLKKKTVTKGSEFLEEEADWSSDGAPDESDSDQSDGGDLNEYDGEDSFINDNSMLTQISPTQRVARSSKISKVQANSNNFYLQSLMSPDDHLFAGKRRGCGNKYRMVFSQRHELLNHYINKAGFKVAEGCRTKRRRKTTDEKHYLDGDKDLFETDSSSSEAEEVNVHYGEEELSQSFGHETCSDPSVISVNESCHEETPEKKMKPCIKRKRKAAFLSDSDMDISARVAESKTAKRINESMNERNSKPHSAKGETNVINDSKRPMSTCTLGRATIPTGDDVIISPSLLASIKIIRTPSCFSLGMDDWIEDIDFQSE